MKMEKEKLQLMPFDLEAVRRSGILANFTSRFKLNPLQMEMLELMTCDFSIEQIVNEFLRKNILISFRHLQDLLGFLVQERLLQNASIQDYFLGEKSGLKSRRSETAHDFDSPTGNGTHDWRQEITHLPFFRSLDPRLSQVFLENVSFAALQPGVVICHEGQRQRSLFVLLEGLASVVKKDAASGLSREVAVLQSGSVFGEVGFFMNEPRTAHVVTKAKCRIARFRYVPEVFDSLIKQEVAKSLQRRFWLIHALLKSELFRAIPDDCFDSLLFSGAIREFPKGTTLCAEGEPGESCFILIQGKVAITQAARTIRTLGQGDCFGEVALVRTQGKRSATATAATEVMVLEIHYKSFYQLLSQNLPLACEIEKLALARLADDRHEKAKRPA